MCSLGHHEDVATPSARVQRQRAASGSVAGPARPGKPRITRKQLKLNRAAILADLSASVGGEDDPSPFEPEQMELLPPHEQNLPADYIPRGEVTTPWWLDR